MRRNIFGLIIIGIGAMMLLKAMGLADFDWFFDQEWKKYIIPAVIIFLGLKVLFGGARKSHSDHMKVVDIPPTNEGQIISTSIAFSGSRYNFSGQKFYGAKMNVFCGGATIDLRGADIQDNCVISISTLMGGVDIITSGNTNVMVESSCLLGGVGNKTVQQNTADVKTILVKASCLMGGVEIKG